MKRIKGWWTKRTLNEKLMIGLIVVLVIGICTRLNYISGEIAEAFTSRFR